MANLAAVHLALKQGDKKQATQLLKIVLKEHPSPNAWYTAARLTDNKAMAIKYLKRALTMDPNHIKSRDMLHRLGGKHTGISGSVVDGIRSEVDQIRQGEHTLSKMTYRQKLMLAASVSLLVVVLVISVAINLFGIRIGGVGRRPEGETTNVYSDLMISHFDASELDIIQLDSVSPPENTVVQEYFIFTIADSAAWHEVKIYLYNEPIDLLSDQDYLADQVIFDNGVVYRNAVMTYPPALESEVSKLLEDTFKSIPTTE
jgi:hypothetical protein